MAGHSGKPERVNVAFVEMVGTGLLPWGQQQFLLRAQGTANPSRAVFPE